MKIKVVAPSSTICKEDLPELYRGKEFVESIGAKVDIDKEVTNSDIKAKINSLNLALTSKADLVICACGGEGAINVIKGIDIKNIKVPVMGFSDITSILNYLFFEKNIVTYHGCNLKTFGREGNRKMDEACFIDFKKVFLEGKYSIEEEKFRVINRGECSGTLIGGNLTCFMQLADIYPIDLENKILLIEELGYESSKEDLKSNLIKLTKLKNYSKLKGVILGDYVVSTKDKIEDVFKEVNKNICIPVIKTEKIGHGKTNLIVPIGKKIKVDLERDYAKIKIC